MRLLDLRGAGTPYGRDAPEGDPPFVLSFPLAQTVRPLKFDLCPCNLFYH